MDVTQEIRKFLDSKGVKYKVMYHDPTPTSEIAAKIRGTTLEQAAKALVFRSKGKFLMCVLPGNMKVELNKVRNILDEKSLSLASYEEVERITYTKPGGVAPFGNLFDIPVYMDRHLLNQDELVFNAGKQTVSIMMKAKDYVESVRPIVEDFAYLKDKV